jgi:hypothetical protein
MGSISIAATVASALLVSVAIVALDPRHRRRLIPLGHLGLALCIALPVVRFAAYIFAGGTPPPMEAIDAIDHWHDRLFAESTLLGGLTLIPAFLLIVLLFILTPISIALAYLAAPVAVIYLGVVVVIATPHLVMVPRIATRHVARGAGAVLLTTFELVVFLVTKPRSLKKVKGVTSSDDTPVEDVRDARQSLMRELDEVCEALGTPWKKPTAAVKSHVEHYRAYLSKHRLRIFTEYSKTVGMLPTRFANMSNGGTNSVSETSMTKKDLILTQRGGVPSNTDKKEDNKKRFNWFGMWHVVHGIKDFLDETPRGIERLTTKIMAHGKLFKEMSNTKEQLAKLHGTHERIVREEEQARLDHLQTKVEKIEGIKRTWRKRQRIDLEHTIEKAELEKKLAEITAENKQSTPPKERKVRSPKQRTAQIIREIENDDQIRQSLKVWKSKKFSEIDELAKREGLSAKDVEDWKGDVEAAIRMRLAKP